jgi:hypothetical protein
MGADGWSALGAHGLTFEFATRRALLASRRRRLRLTMLDGALLDRRPSRPVQSRGNDLSNLEAHGQKFVWGSSKDRRTHTHNSQLKE